MTASPIASIEEGKRLIAEHIGPPETFHLVVPDVLNDPVGINMAILTDHILGRGWEPNGFVQGAGFRNYRFRTKDSPR